MCSNRSEVPLGDACATLGELLQCGSLTSQQVFESERNNTNAWLLLARQTTAGFLNRLDASRYESVAGMLADFLIDGSRRELLAYCRESATEIPFVSKNSKTGKVLISLASQLYPYNDNRTAVDLGWNSCQYGAGAVDWDREALGIAPTDTAVNPEVALYQAVTIILGISTLSLLAVLIYVLAVHARKREAEVTAHGLLNLSELDNLVS